MTQTRNQPGQPPAINPLDRARPPLERLSWGRRAGDLLARSGSWSRANAFLVALFVVAAGLFFAAVLGIGELYEEIVAANGVTPLDRAVQHWTLTHRLAGATDAIAFFSNTGGPVLQPIITGVIVIGLCLTWRSWTPLVLILLAEGGALAMTSIGKKLAGRDRPPLPDSVPPYEYSASFPSGHTLNATVIAAILFYLLAHRFRGTGARVVVGILAALYAVTMGLSRVYLGHHWLTDVVAGWLLGVAWAWIVATAHQLWLTARRRLRVPHWDSIGTAPDPAGEHHADTA